MATATASPRSAVLVMRIARQSLWLLRELPVIPLLVLTVLEVGIVLVRVPKVLLVLSLACTPLNTVFGFKAALKVRRALGLYAFLYVCLHFLTFVGLDYGFNPGLIYEAIFEKRYALVGFAAFLLLLALAITSTQGWMKKLGKNWKRLHRLVYLAGLLVVIHYVWLVKSDIREPLAYGGVVVLLLVARIPAFKKAVMKLRSGLIKRMETDPTPDRV